jgi:hypothetical protein
MTVTGGVYLTKTGTVSTGALFGMVMVMPSRGAVPVLALCRDIYPEGVQAGAPPPPPPPHDASRDNATINRIQLCDIVFMDHVLLSRQISNLPSAHYG